MLAAYPEGKRAFTVFEILQPEGWAQPRGYSNGIAAGIAAEGRIVFVAGQIGWNAECQFESDDLVDQTRQTLANIVAVLAEAGAEPRHIARMTWYIKDKQQYLAAARDIGAAYRELIGPHYPAMTLIVVADLLEDRALVEIEATAVLSVDV